MSLLLGKNALALKNDRNVFQLKTEIAFAILFRIKLQR